MLTRIRFFLPPIQGYSLRSIKATISRPHIRFEFGNRLQYFSSSPSKDDVKLVVDAVGKNLNERDEQERSISNIPGSQSGGKKLAIVFTCKVCETRSAKQFTERAYRHGVVLVKCPGCNNQHLIADRLGFFEDQSWDIEKLIHENGERVTAVTNENVMEITLKDVLGDKYDEAIYPIEEDSTEIAGDINNDK
jgi:mitochondrial protein import protein ZIM17